MRQGILAAFDEANRHGGISGRTLELKSLDDGYEPEKTIDATQKIIDEDKVFAMIGAVGTPVSYTHLDVYKRQGSGRAHRHCRCLPAHKWAGRVRTGSRRPSSFVLVVTQQQAPAIGVHAALQRRIGALGGGVESQSVGQRLFGRGPGIGEGDDFFRNHPGRFFRRIRRTGGEQHQAC